MKFESQIRRQIRKHLLENSNIGTQAGEEIDYSPEEFEAMKDLVAKRRQDQEERLGNMKKGFGIPSHPDANINRMMKRTDKSKMDDIEDDIEATEDQEDELDKAMDAMEKLRQRNQEYQNQIDKMSQASVQVQSDSDITNV